MIVLSACLACQKADPVKVKQILYPLPGDRFFPEGIAYNAKTGVFYTGSTVSGDIVQVNVETGATETIANGAKQGRTFCTGMKLDNRDRLWVCGGSTGSVFLLKTDGTLIKSWDLLAQYGAGFINDCITDKNYIYFTDSQQKNIYRSSLAGDPGNIEKWLSFTDQQIPYGTGTAANGIEFTPDGKYLIIVVSNSGKLYRIGIADKSIREITTNETLPSGDGLLLDNNVLYVSRNATGKLFPVQLLGDYTSGVVGAGFGDNLIGNTTLAKAGKYALVVNGQLSRRQGTVPPQLPFTVARVALP